MKMRSTMAATLFSWIFVSSLHSQSFGVSAINANVTQALVYMNYGDDNEIFCFISEEAISSLPPTGERLCRYYHIDEKTNSRNIIVNATNSAISGQVGPGTYEYFGNGVRNGQCGLKMFTVSEDQVGEWGCSFIAADNFWQASIDVLKYEKPEPPTIMIDGFKTETQINVTDFQNETDPQNSTNMLCCSVGGEPIADTKLTFYLDEKVIPDVVLKKNDSATTCIQWNKIFTKEYNDQILVCRVSHPGFKNLDEESQDHHLRVNIEYSPEIVYVNLDGNFITKRIYKDNNEIDLYFTVKGNPIPSVDMKRNVTPEGDSQEFELEDVRIKNVTVHSERNSNEFIVTIDVPNEDGSDAMFQITVENYLGMDVGVTIVTPPPDDNGSTTWILIAVGVVMSLIFIGIIVCVINNEAKNRGWFGYEARKEKYKIKTVANAASKREQHEYSSVAEMDESRF